MILFGKHSLACPMNFVVAPAGEFALVEEPAPTGGTLRVAPCWLHPWSDCVGPLLVKEKRK